MNSEKPTYDFVVIIPFSCVGLLCLFSIYWNCVIFDIPFDIMGGLVGLIGIASLGAVINYTISVWKLRKNFVWEVLKYER